MYRHILKSLSIFCTVMATAQTNTPVGQQVTPAHPAQQAPLIVTNRFATDFPNTTATWHHLGEDQYMAEFTLNNLKNLAVYDGFGKRLRQAAEVPLKKHPKPIAAYLKSSYPDTMLTLYSQKDHNGNQTFFSVFGSDSVFFDARGKPVPKTKP